MLETWVLPEDLLIVYDLDLVVRNREQKLMLTDVLSKTTEMLDGKSETYEVEPAVSLKCELASALVSKFLDESLLVSEI